MLQPDDLRLQVRFLFREPQDLVLGLLELLQRRRVHYSCVRLLDLLAPSVQHGLAFFIYDGPASILPDMLTHFLFVPLHELIDPLGGASPALSKFFYCQLGHTAASSRLILNNVGKTVTVGFNA